MNISMSFYEDREGEEDVDVMEEKNECVYV
jgi:hypothetical protein